MLNPHIAVCFDDFFKMFVQTHKCYNFGTFLTHSYIQAPLLSINHVITVAEKRILQKTQSMMEACVISTMIHPSISFPHESLLGFVHTGADPFWICSRLGLIHTGPVCTALEQIRPTGVRM